MFRLLICHECHNIKDLSSIILYSNRAIVGEKMDGKIEGKMKIQKLEYLENENSFSDEIKIIFHSL